MTVISIVLDQVMPLYTVFMVQNWNTSFILLKVHENCGVAQVELSKPGKYSSTYDIELYPVPGSAVLAS